VTGQVFGSEGYSVTCYYHMSPERTVYNKGPWELDEFFKVMKRTRAICKSRGCSRDRLAGNGDAMKVWPCRYGLVNLFAPMQQQNEGKASQTRQN